MTSRQFMLAAIIIFTVILTFISEKNLDASGVIVRTWSNQGIDDSSIHAMGNGEIVVYGQGPNLGYIYGPPYSSPNILSLTTEFDGTLTDEATREQGTAIWQHKSRSGNELILELTEFVASDSPAYIRSFKCSKEGVRWIIHPNPTGSFVKCPSIANGWLQVIRPGQNIFNYPSNLWSYHWIIPQGSCKIEKNSKGELVVSCLHGEGSLSIVGSSEYPNGTSTAERLARDGAKSFLEPTRSYWKSFTNRRIKAKPELSKLPANVQEALDSTAVLIKTQQSKTGGVMAGHYYALAYIRDQYGTAKGMLSLGMIDEARSNLEFRLRKFQRFGSLQTAEAMGTDCARHVHENDEVEGPAYTILQARDYIEITKDNAFGLTLWPMLEWCWNVQQKHLSQGLLPFNGDETYVAGGFYPRSGLLQGSADSTLVFIEAGKWLAEWAVSQGLWTSEYAKKQSAVLSEAREAYRRVFLDKDRIWANAPEREETAVDPRFRHGVCEGICGWFGWTERTQNGRYTCPVCLVQKDLPVQKPLRMEVNSVSLLPAYIGSDIVSKDEMRPLLDHILAQANKSGHIPSVPGTEGCVGYDPGLILISLDSIDHPKAREAFDRVLNLLDKTHAWNEYYDASDLPRNGCCRARPWESAINAHAVISYLE